MGELWRSQEMQLVQLYLQVEAVHDSVDEIAKEGLMQFRDLKPHVNIYQRSFVNEIKRLDALRRVLTVFDREITEHNEKIRKEKKEKKLMIKIRNAPSDWAEKRVHLDELESNFEDLERSLQQFSKNNQLLESNYVQLIELKNVLQKDERFFSEGDVSVSESDATENEPGTIALDDSVRLNSVSGVINRESFFLFEKLLWRVMKGSLLMNYDEIEEDILDTSEIQGGPKYVKKNAFIIFFPGKMLEYKVEKICQSLGAHIYKTPKTRSGRKKMLSEIDERIIETDMLRDSGMEQRKQMLFKIALELRTWENVIKKEKAIYHTMNMFNYDLGRKCLIAEGWCPSSCLEKVQIALRVAREKSGALVPSILNVLPHSKYEVPPTYFITNKFTYAFQSIVDSYGVARYQEVNPAVLTIITFPFEFGVMFGDVGHGFLLLLFSLLMLKMEKKWQGKKINEMFEITYHGRYVLLLMSLFSIYQGALYNEIFAIPMDYGSNYVLQIGPGLPNNTFFPRFINYAYPFGVDPVWKGASNELLYYNSLKMKMSILIGVLQMTIGLSFHLLNGIYFRKWLDVFFEFIPRATFLLSIFGYLCFMIVFKWNVNYIGQDALNRANGVNGTEATGRKAGTSQAPVILNELIYMFLPGGPGNHLYDGQQTVQTILVVLAFLSIPIMMLPKPLILKWQHDKQNKNKSKKYKPKHRETVEDNELDNVDLNSDSDNPSGGEDKNDHMNASPDQFGEEFEFGELMVHQVLETIEFVLGSVSHTASYLRLWALSLAHSELATVFWDKIFGTTITVGLGSSFGVVAILTFIGYSAWFFATLLVILFMESLSAFLHALRLHWVEFQSKFYKGDGHPFLPLSYKRILSEDPEEL